MGQQQLLLLVLGIVIVGLAVVVGIQAFGENQSKANADALINDGIRIASDAQAWALKPTAFGGGDGDFLSGPANDVDVSFDLLGYDNAGGVYDNVNGNFEISAVTAAGFTVTGCSRATFGDTVNLVAVVVDGFSSDNITTTVTRPATCPE